MNLEKMFMELGLITLMYYSVIVIYTVILVRTINGIINMIFHGREDSYDDRSYDWLIWLIFLIVCGGVIFGILVLRGII